MKPVKRLRDLDNRYTWDFDKAEAEAQQYDGRNPEPFTCTEFGCGRTLSPQEKMFGKKCIEHNMKGATIMSKPKENLFTPDCIRTFSGQYVNVFEPDPATIIIEDIAHALSHQVRFGGHLPEPYSVLQHLIFCCDMAAEPHKFAALMHDASEAYLLDVPRPVKLRLDNYKSIEDRLMETIATKFGFQFPFDPEVKRVDEKMLRIEWHNLMIQDRYEIDVYTPQKARVFFMNRFNQYKTA